MPNERHRSPAFYLHGYKAFTVYFDDGSKKTVYEHREIMERHFGRRLNQNEIVHHKDGNRKNNDVSNLEIKDRVKHAVDHAKERGGITMITVKCLSCKKYAQKELKNVKGNLKKGRAGPFCGKVCSGRYSANVGWKKIKSHNAGMADRQR